MRARERFATKEETENGREKERERERTKGVNGLGPRNCPCCPGNASV